jgi:aspartyl-tRNA(Asn)/glutamyl-tRNA(Gln) amidotransferase subunit A
MLDDEVRHGCEEAVDTFRAFGCHVDVLDTPVENAEPAWRVLQQSNWAARFFDRIEELAPLLDPSFVEGIRACGAYTGQQVMRATYKRTEHFRAVQSWFSTYRLVLTPTMSRPPLEADHAALEAITIGGQDAGDMRYSWVPYLNLFDLTGHPAISIPCGWTNEGLPVGLQIVGPWYQDAAVLRAAVALERARPWDQRLPPMSPS